jgi:hypothetical protein
VDKPVPQTGDRSPEGAFVLRAERLGGFSVSPAEVDGVAAYIEGQEEYHRTVSFQDEYRRFFKEYEVEYDERYVWG